MWEDGWIESFHPVEKAFLKFHLPQLLQKVLELIRLISASIIFQTLGHGFESHSPSLYDGDSSVGRARVIKSQPDVF